MEIKKRENAFLIIWISCLLLLVGVCNIGFIRGTRAAFGNVTGQISIPCTIKYISNYPSELGIENNEYSEKVKCGITYTILDNTFTASGYQFVNWNETIDGTGKVYIPGESITVGNNMTFYGQWSLAPEDDEEKDEEEVVVSYGDVNQNGTIDKDDYLLVEYHVSGVSKLTDQSLLNADVNADGNIDLVDADIIKQAYLGTLGYVDILPSNPILIYEIYKGDVSSDGDGEVNSGTGDKEETADGNGTSQGGSDGDTSSDESDDDLDVGNSSGSSSNGSGTGTGSSGSGNSSSGTGSGGNTSSGGGGSDSGNGNKPSSGNSSSNSSGNQNSSSVEEKEEDTDNKDSVIKDDNVSTESEETDDKSNEICDIYEFTIGNDEKPVASYVGIIVFIICLLALRLIIHVVFKFNQNNKNNENVE